MENPSRLLSRIDEKRAIVSCPECNKGHVTTFYVEGKKLYIYCNECMSNWEDFPPIGGYAIARRKALEGKN